MKHYALGLLLISSSMTLHAAPAAIDTSALGAGGNSKPGIGFTVSTSSRPYRGADNTNAALPYFRYEKNRFYVDGLNLGFRLSKNPGESSTSELGWRWDVLFVPRFLGYKVDESAELEGLDDIDYSVHGGLSVSLLNAPVNLNAQVLTDVLGISDGTEVNATISKSFSYDRFNITPAFGLNWQNARLVDFYYGVNESQATESRSQFTGASSLNANVSLTAGYAITSSLLAIGSVKVDALSESIADSPLVDRSTVNTATVGLVYSF